MALTTTHLLVFGDQVIDKRPMIRSLVRNSKSSPAARTFLLEATDLVQNQLAQLTPDEHGWSGDFDSLLGLAEEHAALEANNAALLFIATLLCLIGRLGDLIVRAERDPTILGSKDRPSHVLALCAGQLPAAVAVAARDTSELLLLAREVIVITCRWLRVVHRNRLAMISPYEVGGWSITYTGLDRRRVQTILDDFHAAQDVPALHKISIAVVSRSWLTLVGPSSSHRRLAAYSPDIRRAPRIPADVGAPAHAPFMTGVDAEKLVGHSDLLDRALDWHKVTMINPSMNYDPWQQTTCRELLIDIFEDILERPLLVDRVIESSVSHLDHESRVLVHEVGSTTYMPMILKAIGVVGMINDVVPPYQAPPLGSLPTRGKSDLIAIVGMSGRFPGGDSVAELWTEIIKGACHIKRVPESRFDVNRYYDVLQKLKNSTNVTDGAWLSEPGSFDHRFFNISPREAMQMDPAHRLCLTVTQEALDMAGYAPNASPSMDPGRVSTWIGDTNWDWPETVHEMGTDIYYAGAIGKAFLSGRLSYHYKFGRGSHSIDSACASSTTAITLACKSLLGRDSDMAVAGGVSVLTAPMTFSGLARSGMLAPEGGCRTFHDDADGYARGEGIGVVILKRLEDAMADRDHILGVISGSARTYSATSTSITHPSHTSQEMIYREVLGQTAIDPEEIVYVEMHGTGTQAGDFEELTSVVNVMGGRRRPDNPLTVGAVKAAVGHGEGVAGVTALIKTLLMLQHRVIPSQPGVPFKVNRRFPPLDEHNVHIALETKPLVASPKAADGKIKMLVNTFDASGGICSLVIEEAPELDYEGNLRPQDVRSGHVVALSARSDLSLRKNCENLLDYLQTNPDIRLSDLAYTTTARRIHTSLRKAFVCESTSDLMRQLREPLAERIRASHPPRVVFLFTGQGSQYQSMGMDLYKTSPRFRDMMEAYQLTASNMTLPQFLPIISGAVQISTVSPTQVQLATIALELGVAHMLRSWGIVPDVVVGHSLGEYAALCVAGVLSPSDALYLVGRRGQLMEKHLTPNTHAMLATQMSAQAMTDRIKQENTYGAFASCAVACHNGPNATVASGTETDMRAMQDLLTSEGVRCTLLRVPFGFHSAQVEPILGEFERIATGVTFKKPIVPVASTLLGQIVDAEGVFSPNYLARQAREPVSFVEGLRAAAGLVPGDTTIWVETGPDATCLAMVRETIGVDAARLLPVLKRQKDNWRTISAVLKVAYELGAPIDWKAYHGEFIECLGLLSDLPTYGWDYKSFWTPYTAPPPWEVEEAFALASRGGQKAIEAAPDPDTGFAPTFSVHRLVKEEHDDPTGKWSMVFASETKRPGLKNAVEGHVVVGHVIAPLFVFCDIALTGARHCYFRARDSVLESTRATIRDIAITHAVVLTTSSQPTILTTVSYSPTADFMTITFHQESKNGKRGPLIGQCRIDILAVGASKPISPAIHQNLFLVRTRMQQLQDLASSGKAHRLLRDVVYRLFGAHVRYGPEYHSMDEVIVSTGSQDALATITAPMGNAATASTMNCLVYDGVNHLTGFLLNNTLRCADDQIMYLFEGFAELQQIEELVPGRKYTSYAAGQDLDETGTVVDVVTYVFDAEDGRLVQMSSGLRATKVKKVVLKHLLGSAADDAPRHSAPATNHARKPSHSSSPRVDIQPEQPVSQAAIMEASVPARDLGNSHDASLVSRVLEIVAGELDIGLGDMTDDIAFSELGLDSMMSITILLTVRNELNVDLPFGFFMENETVGAAKQALPQHMQETESARDAPPSPAISSVTPSASALFTDDPESLRESISKITPGLTPEIISGTATGASTGASTSSFIGTSTEVNQNESPNPDTHNLNKAREHEVDTTRYHANPPNETARESASTPVEHETRVPTTPDAARGLENQVKCRLTPLQTVSAPGDGSPPSSAPPPLVLFASETSSSVTYVQLPHFGGRAVYGVDWPIIESRPQHRSQSEMPDPPPPLSSLVDAVIASLTTAATASPPLPPPPYVLGGISFGAVLALEVARRLPHADVAGILVLDPPAGPRDILSRAAATTAATTAPAAAAREARAAFAAAAMEGHRVGDWTRPGGRVVLVVPETGEGRDRWCEGFPEAEVRTVVGARAGGFWRFPAINTVGAACRDVVTKMWG